MGNWGFIAHHKKAQIFLYPLLHLSPPHQYVYCCCCFWTKQQVFGHWTFFRTKEFVSNCVFIFIFVLLTLRQKKTEAGEGMAIYSCYNRRDLSLSVTHCCSLSFPVVRLGSEPCPSPCFGPRGPCWTEFTSCPLTSQ